MSKITKQQLESLSNKAFKIDRLIYAITDIKEVDGKYVTNGFLTINEHDGKLIAFKMSESYCLSKYHLEEILVGNVEESDFVEAVNLYYNIRIDKVDENISTWSKQLKKDRNDLHEFNLKHKVGYSTLVTFHKHLVGECFYKILDKGYMLVKFEALEHLHGDNYLLQYATKTFYEHGFVRVESHSSIVSHDALEHWVVSCQSEYGLAKATSYKFDNAIPHETWKPSPLPFEFDDNI